MRLVLLPSSIWVISEACRLPPLGLNHSCRTSISQSCTGVHTVDKDRIAGSIEQAKGIVKEAVGKATGNTKLVVEGEADQVLGKVQDAVGRLKDAARDAVKK